MLFKNTISTEPFPQWLIKNNENKKLLIFSLLASIISFSWIKLLYPFPNFMPPDSIWYVEAAQNNDFINIWPIGYSMFLRLTSSFSNSHMFLIALQYTLLQASLFYFLLSIRYLLSPEKWTFRILFVILVINPLSPHIANYVSSDCLFISLSILWITQLLWLLYSPSLKKTCIHGIVLLLAFMVRYYALYYPLLSIGIICLAQLSNRSKFKYISIIILPVLTFIGRTQYEYHLKTGTSQYAAFGGWQLAANSLYGYAHSKPILATEVPLQFQRLHDMVNQHMDSLSRRRVRPDDEIGVYYLWDPKSPLWRFMNDRWKKAKDSMPLFTQWAKMAPLYHAYGRFLISHYPLAFTKNYLLPNFERYYVPPASFMRAYNLYRDTVDRKASTWFGWKNNKTPIRLKSRKIKITEVISRTPVPVTNLIFLLSYIAFILAGGLSYCSQFSKRTLVIIMALWFINLIFSIITAPTELRYQIFPITITFCFMWLLISWLIKQVYSPVDLNSLKDKNLAPITN